MPYTNAPTNNMPTPIPPEVVNPHPPQNASRETSPSTFNTNVNNTPRETDILTALQQATREEMSSQIAPVIQSIKDMFISLQRENARLQADIVQIAHRVDQVQSNAHRTTATTQHPQQQISPVIQPHTPNIIQTQHSPSPSTESISSPTSSSEVTKIGPIEPVLSKFLPIVH